MNLKGRVQRLEELAGADRGRCPVCRNRPANVAIQSRRDPPDAEPVPLDSGGDSCEPCPACGWQPDTLEIVEVVVHTREQARAALRQMSETAEPEKGYP
jgi:hypothetical protein